MTERSDAADAPASVDPEFELAMQAPAFWTNRFYLSGTEGGIRFAFAETGGAAPQYRAAFVMPAAHAAEMHAMLGEMLGLDESATE